MKTFTNHTVGPKGINTDEGTVWIDPGQSVELDPKKIKGKVPDLGKAAPEDESDDGDLKALKKQVTSLTKQVEDLTAEKDTLAKTGADAAKEADDLKKENAALTKQVEDLTKPAK